MDSQHPSESDLRNFANGELDDVRFEVVATHVEHCGRCAAFLSQTDAFKSPFAVTPTEQPHRPLLREHPASGGRKPRSGERGANFPPEVAGTQILGSSKYGIAELAGSRVGPYKLLQELGEGGMGVVYMAEQEKPVRRMVALKIIKPGMDSQQVIARFEAERQALAMMDHHHIAKVLDAGTTDTGRPYFAMELVKGVPITEYCDKNKLTPRERLEMFVPVCHAIQHAHQKGIIHRDIKPSNVLVTLYDGKPVPKVIDFGIAKATQQKLTERTMFTGIGQILGTLEYMSPEQAEMNQLDIDTRSDVYSLGVMLYELLTGSTPITKEKLRNVGLEEMLRTIRETEPPKPSTRLSDSAEALPSISAVRKTEPTKLSKLVRGDLDWIVMKALEKDRTRRYETANGLAADVQRFLNNEVVEACPPSAGYRFRKFARRNKTALATGVTVATILIAATVLSSTLAVWANRASKVATLREQEATQAALAEQEARQDEEAQRKLAEENAAKANREATKSREVATFLKDMLKGVGPSVALGRDTKMLREILEKTAERLDEDLTDQPEVEAELRATIGDVYRELGQRTEEEAMRRRVLELRKQLDGPRSRETVIAMRKFAESLVSASDRKEILDEVLAIQRELYADDQVELAHTLDSLSEAYSREGNWPAAERLTRKATEIKKSVHGRDSIEVAKSISYLASVIHYLERHDESEVLWREALAIQREKLGDVHPDVAKTTQDLALAVLNQGKYDEGVRLLRTALQYSRALYGKYHPNIAAVLLYLARCEWQQGEFDKAEELFLESFDQFQQLDGPRDFFCDVEYRLASLYQAQERYVDAEPLLRRAYAGFKAFDRQKLAADAVLNLTTVLARLGKHEDAVGFLEEAVKNGDAKAFEYLAMNAVWKDDNEAHQELCETIFRTARVDLNASTMRRVARSVVINPNCAANLVDQAAKLARQSFELEKRDDWKLSSSWALGLAKLRQQKYEEADALFRQSGEILRGETGNTQEAAACCLAMSAYQQGKTKLAAELLQKADQIVGIQAFTDFDSTLELGHAIKGILALREAQRLINGSARDITSLSDEERVSQALALEAAAAKATPQDTDQTKSLAWFYLWFGRTAEYNELCHDIVAHAESLKEDNEDSYFACERAANACTWTPESSRELVRRSHNLAMRAIDLSDGDVKRAWATFLRGVAEYRLGNSTQAEETLSGVKVAGSVGTLMPQRLLFLAMAHHDLGKTDQAQKEFDKATTLLPPRPSRSRPSVELFRRGDHASAIWLLYEETRDHLALEPTRP